jgi:LacI family transcriptional regulator
MKEYALHLARMDRKATQNDVARLAKVSVATVSRYINQTGRISAGVRKRIGKAVEDLRYKPNLVARTLKIRSSNTIGLIFPDIENPFFISLIRKAEEVAQKHGHSVILCNTENKAEKEIAYLEVMKAKQVDGYLVIPTVSASSALREMLFDEKVVFLDRKAGSSRQDVTVTLDNSKAVNLAIDYLVRLGHTRISVIAVPTVITTGQERLDAYREALRNNGLAFDEKLVRYADYSVQGALQEARKLLCSREKPTAILPLSGLTTVGVLMAIRELNLRIPDDISVIGFDDSEYADLLVPPLTRIAQPAYEFGSIGTELLLKLMRGEAIARKNIVLEPKLLERSSCRDLRRLLSPH